MQARIIPENGPPRSVLDRTGFRKERLLRSGAVIRDRHVDMLLFTLTHASGAHAARGPARTGSG